MHRRHFCPTLATLLLAWSAAASAHSPPIAPGVPFWRPPVLLVQGAEQPVRLQALQLDVDVAGRIAQTRVRMDFYNPNARPLEGKLQFPLSAGQIVSGFALDVDGELRDAVPVEKTRAQQVFEDITRRRVDPGLLQTTVGNNYELRLYPLPPGRTRTVVLTITEPAAPRLQIPLAYASRVTSFALQLRYPTATSTPAFESANPLGLRFERDRQGGYTAQLRSGETTLPAQGLLVRAESASQSATTTENRGGETYFTLSLPIAERGAARRLPARMQLIWDASGSAAGRRFDREFALLDAYFQRAGSVDVNLVRVADTAGRLEPFAVRRGDWHVLRHALEETVYDGASNLGAVTHDGVSQEALWFTDGLANYGTPWSPKFAVPAFTINSAAAANPAALRALAETSGGRSIDLNTLSAAEASRALLQRGWQLLDVAALGAKDVVVQSVHPEQGSLSLAGVMTERIASLTLRLRGPDGHDSTRVLRVAADANPSRLAGSQWARIKLAELQGDARLNHTRIRELGQRFGMATDETSLLVLDRVEDYVQHEIEPPPALREAYQRLAGNAQRAKRSSDAARLAQVVQRFETRVTWWNTEFPKDEPRRAVAPTRALEMTGAVGSVSESARRERAPTAPTPSTAPSEAPATALQPMLQGLASDAAKKQVAATSPASISIALKPASRTAPYIKRLETAEANEWVRIYLDERRENAASVGFYLDAAEFFFAHKLPAQALRVLSNLAELDLQNRQILRLLGYRLTQAGEVALALPVFERVLELAPYEPQSHRDLGLALAQASQGQRAIERLYEVVTGQWDSRFPDIDLIALTELNSVVDEAARAARPLDTSFVEPKLLRNLPLDLRVVLAWDADNTDVDLHVIDPNGEEVYYGHNASYQGGAITRDATGGYGPEEFALRVAKAGKYRVEANFYGHRQQVLTSNTGLMLWLSSGWGTPRQQDQRSTVRVRSERGERIVIGAFEVKR
jgi:Ca-activated chloride channel family protein